MVPCKPENSEPEHPTAYGRGNKQILSVTAIMQAAHQLECRWLELPDIDHKNRTTASSSRDLSATQRFGNLRKLVIPGLIASGPDLCKFLRQSVPHLQRVRISNSRHTVDTCGFVFDTFRGLRRLESIDWCYLRVHYDRLPSAEIEEGGFLSCQCWTAVTTKRQRTMSFCYDCMLGRPCDDPWLGLGLCEANHRL